MFVKAQIRVHSLRQLTQVEVQLVLLMVALQHQHINGKELQMQHLLPV